MSFNHKDFFYSYEDVSGSTEMVKGKPQHKISIFADPAYQQLIVPNRTGKCLLANYYKEKYGIDIFIISKRDDLRACIDRLRELPGHVKTGFVVNATSQEEGHVVPIIYEKNADEEAVISFDTNGPKGMFGFGIEKIDEIVNTGRSRKINVYANDILDPTAMSASRQIDLRSCTNDAFAILKDVLREDKITDIVKEQAKKKFKTLPEKYIPFLLPEEWSKTVQREKYFDSTVGTNPNSKKILRSIKIKSSGKEKKSTQTFKKLREKHTTELVIQQLPLHEKIDKEGKMSEERGVVLESKKSKVNVYLKRKGYSNVKRVQQQFEAHKDHIDSICKDRQAGILLGSKSPSHPAVEVDETKQKDTPTVSKRFR